VPVYNYIWQNNNMIRIGLLMLVFSTGCQSSQDNQGTLTKSDSISPAKAPAADTLAPALSSASAAYVLSRKQIPVLCYHQIRDWKPTDSKRSKDYIVPVDVFRAQIKMLADSGYHSILPDQLYQYLTKGIPLPAKPVLLTFDDTDEDQFGVAFTEMKKYGFK